MGCSSCSSGGGLPKGCKSNGSCATDGCDKLSVFDWLSDMELPSGQRQFDVYEVRFKNGRKGFFRNVNDLKIQLGDIVAVECSPGHDIGTISLSGELVKLQLRRKAVKAESNDVLKIYRKANQKDIDTWQNFRERETDTMYRARNIVKDLKLDMKLSDVEYQGDGSKATFFYTADDRVDFRELIKLLAKTFSCRIEMKQIGARQEAARLGGIGSCGRELCCSTWLHDFRSVSTSAARYQQLSLNPQKLAGQCGKLKCCLNYELDSYVEALKEFPNTNTFLKTKKGIAKFQKMDIFRKMMWYSKEDDPIQWIPVKTEDVHAIIELNKRGEQPESLDVFLSTETIEKPDFSQVEDDLKRFDRQKRRPQTKKKNPKQSKYRANPSNNQSKNRNK